MNNNSKNSKWGTVKSGDGNAQTPTKSNNNNANISGGGMNRGTMIMKSVSIFLASGRRASGTQNKAGGDSAGNSKNQSGRRKSKFNNKMEDASGKINPKVIDAFKKKTHFSKIEIEALCRIYKKLVSNCLITSRALAATTSSFVIAKPHATIETSSAPIGSVKDKIDDNIEEETQVLLLTINSDGTQQEKILHVQGIDRIVFRELLHSTFDIVTEETLMERIFCAWDKGHEGLPLRLEGWLIGLSVFLRGSTAEKMAFCFRVYDLNSDGFITRDEMFTLLKNCLIKQPQDEDPDEGVRDLVEIALRKFDIDKDSKVSFQDFQTAVTEEPLLLEAFGQCLPSDGATISFLSTLQG